MKVLDNLFGNNTKINAKAIAAFFDNNPQTLDVILDSLKIESGSNANGSYLKFPDGTLICRRTFTYQLGAGNTYTTFAHQFIDSEVSLVINTRDNSFVQMEQISRYLAWAPANYDRVRLESLTGNNGSGLNLIITGFGRWRQ